MIGGVKFVVFSFWWISPKIFTQPVNTSWQLLQSFSFFPQRIVINLPNPLTCRRSINRNSIISGVAWKWEKLVQLSANQMKRRKEYKRMTQIQHSSSVLKKTFLKVFYFFFSRTKICFYSFFQRMIYAKFDLSLLSKLKIQNSTIYWSLNERTRAFEGK